MKLEPRADVRTMGCGSLTRCQRMGMGTVEWTQSTRNQFLDTQPVSVWFLFYSTLMYIDDHWCTLCTVCTVNTPCFGWPLHVRQTSTVQSRSWSCALWSLEMKWNEMKPPCDSPRFLLIPFDLILVQLVRLIWDVLRLCSQQCVCFTVDCSVQSSIRWPSPNKTNISSKTPQSTKVIQSPDNNPFR